MKPDCTSRKKFSRKVQTVVGHAAASREDSGRRRNDRRGDRRGSSGDDCAATNSGGANPAAPTSTSAAIGDLDHIDEDIRQEDANPDIWGPGPAIQEATGGLLGQDYKSSFQDIVAEQDGNPANEMNAGHRSSYEELSTGTGPAGGLHQSQENGGEGTDRTVRVQLEKKRGGKHGRRAYYDLNSFM
jgi:hypothetical protein